MKIKELYADKKRFAHSSFAYDIHGNYAFNYKDRIEKDGSVTPGAMRVITNEAVCYCLVGAIAVCYNDNVVDTGSDKLMAVVRRIADHIRPGRSDAFGAVVQFNDSSDYKDVLAVVEALDL